MADRILTPQQELFLAGYTNPKSPTFSNALQSALKAGYSQEYSESITSQLPDWLSESLGDLQLLRKAEKVMNKTLEMEAVGEDGKIDTPLLSIQNKTAQFVAERLNKGKYSTKIETDITSKGEQITTSNEQFEQLLRAANQRGTDDTSVA